MEPGSLSPTQVQGFFLPLSSRKMGTKNIVISVSAPGAMAAPSIHKEMDSSLGCGWGYSGPLEASLGGLVRGRTTGRTTYGEGNESPTRCSVIGDHGGIRPTLTFRSCRLAGETGPQIRGCVYTKGHAGGTGAGTHKRPDSPCQ